MEQLKCLGCDNMVSQTPKKRPKLYCSNICRQKVWQEKRRQELAVLRANSIQLPDDYVRIENIRRIVGFGEKVIPASDRERKAKGAEKHRNENEKKFTEADQKGMPSSFNELLTMAKDGVADKPSFLKHVENTKMTPGQRSMILAKLK